MIYTPELLKELKEKLYHLSREAQAGKVDPRNAAEEIITLRDEINKAVEYIKKNTAKAS